MWAGECDAGRQAWPEPESMEIAMENSKALARTLEVHGAK